nr:gamma-glutamylcyclotransferase [Hyphomonas sediminis]
MLKQGAAGAPNELGLDVAGDFLGPCRFRGRMPDLGGFPGVVSGDALCHGVRWRIRDASIAPAMDEFEDVTDDPATSLYQRMRLPVLDDQGQVTGEDAWVYIYNQKTDGFSALEDGNWPLDRGKARK